MVPSVCISTSTVQPVQRDYLADPARISLFEGIATPTSLACMHCMTKYGTDLLCEKHVTVPPKVVFHKENMHGILPFEFGWICYCSCYVKGAIRIWLCIKIVAS